MSKQQRKTLSAGRKKTNLFTEDASKYERRLADFIYEPLLKNKRDLKHIFINTTH